MSKKKFLTTAGAVSILAIVGALLISNIRPSDRTIEQPTQSAVEHVETESHALGARSSDSSNEPTNKMLAAAQLAKGRFEKLAYLPNGETLLVTFSAVYSKSDPLPDISTMGGAEAFETLEREALEGNHAAARELVNQIEACKDVPSNAEQLSTLVDGLNQGRFEGNINKPIEKNIEHVRTRYNFCAAISEEMKAQATELLWSSARSGDAASALQAGNLLLEASPEDSAEFFKIAWYKGKAGGAIGLGHVYANRTPQSFDDAVKAYAFGNAGHSIAVAHIDGLTGDVTNLVKQELLDDQFAFSNSLPSSVVTAGTKLARKIIEDRRGDFIF